LFGVALSPIGQESQTRHEPDAGLNDLVMTGPTGTNANDVHIVLVDGSRILGIRRRSAWRCSGDSPVVG
jgi:hypothetical protein